MRLMTPLGKLLALRKHYNTPLIVDRGASTSEVETTTPVGTFYLVVQHGTGEDQTLLDLQAQWNEPTGGDIRDLRGTNFAQSGTPCAWLPDVDRIFRVTSFHGLADANLNIPANNKLHVVFLKSVAGLLSIPAWNANSPIKPSVEAGWYALNDPVREVDQEYQKWIKADGSIYAVDFCYGDVLDLAIKAENTPTLKMNGRDILDVAVPYQSRGAVFDLDGGLNERIEMWSDLNQPYTDANGGAVAILRMAVQFDRMPR